MNTISEIIQDIRLGKMVIIMDDEDRENEGDLVMAASMVKPEDVNFMAQYGRGLICLTLSQDRAERLKLPPMVGANGSQFGTNFTVSIEAASGVTTGISAADRAVTIQAAVAPYATAEDVTQPGHVFPLVAQPGGVLYRAGHTEAGCDLARLAGLEPAAVIVEILNEDGSMARRPDLEKFAERHDLKIGTIADLIEYRLCRDKAVEEVSQSRLETQYGSFDVTVFEDAILKRKHFAFSKGLLNQDYPTLVRVHLKNYFDDLLLSVNQSWSLNQSLEHIAKEGHGVVLVLSQYDDEAIMMERLTNNKKPAEGSDEPEDVRMIGIGSQILSELGLRKLRVMSSPKKLHALSGFDLEVVEYVSINE